MGKRYAADRACGSSMRPTVCWLLKHQKTPDTALRRRTSPPSPHQPATDTPSTYRNISILFSPFPSFKLQTLVTIFGNPFYAFHCLFPLCSRPRQSKAWQPLCVGIRLGVWPALTNVLGQWRPCNIRPIFACPKVPLRSHGSMKL